MKTHILCGLLLLIAVAFINLPVVNASEGMWLLNYSPVSENLLDVFMINANDGWIVGDAGTILHWNGTIWTQVACPVDVDLRAVYMRNAGDGWAVGLDGVAIHWNGTAWTQFPSGTSAHLLATEAIYSPFYYAVGAPDNYIVWNGTHWSQLQGIPTSEALRGIDLDWISIVPPFNYIWGWAIGDSGTTLMRNYTGWYNIPCPTSAELNDVCMVETALFPEYGNLSDVWAVGSGWETIHWNGTEWEIVPNPIKGKYGWLDTVDMVNTSDGWAMGYLGTILHWNGNEWTEAPSPTINNLKSMFMLSGIDGWAVGLEGTIIRWTGSEWIPEFPANLYLPLVLTTTLIAIITKIHLRKRISVR